MAQAPIPPKTKERVAELIGLDLSQPEAAGAVGISERSVARIMAQPEYRKKAEDIMRERTSLNVQVVSVVRDMLEAKDGDNKPVYAARSRAAEIIARNPALFASMEEDEDDSSMLAGVTLLFPYIEGDEPEEQPEQREVSTLPDGTRAVPLPETPVELGIDAEAVDDYLRDQALIHGTHPSTAVEFTEEDFES